VVTFPHMRAASLDEVLANLGAAADGLAPGDGVRYFNRLYTDVTRAVGRLIASGELNRPDFITRLAVRFANAYFEAVAAGDRGPDAVVPAWRPLFEARSDKRVAPIQFVLAAMNAHINYDLPVGLVRTCEEMSVELRFGSPEHQDFRRLNDLLEEAQEGAKRWLLSGLLRRLDPALGSRRRRHLQLEHRSRATRAGTTLWPSGRSGDRQALADAYRDTLAHTVASLAADCSSPPPPSESSAGRNRCSVRRNTSNAFPVRVGGRHRRAWVDSRPARPGASRAFENGNCADQHGRNRRLAAARGRSCAARLWHAHDAVDGCRPVLSGRCAVAGEAERDHPRAHLASVEILRQQPHRCV